MYICYALNPNPKNRVRMTKTRHIWPVPEPQTGMISQAQTFESLSLCLGSIRHKPIKEPETSLKPASELPKTFRRTPGLIKIRSRSLNGPEPRTCCWHSFKISPPCPRISGSLPKHPPAIRVEGLGSGIWILSL